MLHRSRFVALFAFAAALTAFTATMKAGEIVESIIVKVNGDILTKTTRS
jgi:hypothetical protein